MKPDHPSAAQDAQRKLVQYYTAILIANRGKQYRVECKTLSEASAEADKLEMLYPGHTALIYAVVADGGSIPVPRIGSAKIYAPRVLT